MAYCSNYMIHSHIFPTLFLSTSFGIVCSSTRIMSLFIPFISEMDNKLIPLVILALVNIAATMATKMLRKDKE
jgi:hypothetical protein